MEEKLDCDLTDRKKEIDGLVMDFVNSKKGSDDEESEEEESEESEPDTKKRASSGKKPAPKKRKAGSSDESEDSDKGSDDDYKPSKAKGAKGKKKGSSESGSDADWKQEKKPRTKKVSLRRKSALPSQSFNTNSYFSLLGRWRRFKTKSKGHRLHSSLHTIARTCRIDGPKRNGSPRSCQESLGHN